MARKRYSDEDVLRLLRDMELLLAGGNDVASACRSVGISPTRRRFACLPPMDKCKDQKKNFILKIRVF